MKGGEGVTVRGERRVLAQPQQPPGKCAQSEQVCPVEGGRVRWVWQVGVANAP